MGTTGGGVALGEALVLGVTGATTERAGEGGGRVDTAAASLRAEHPTNDNN